VNNIFTFFLTTFVKNIYYWVQVYTTCDAGHNLCWDSCQFYNEVRCFRRNILFQPYVKFENPFVPSFPWIFFELVVLHEKNICLLHQSQNCSKIYFQCCGSKSVRIRIIFFRIRSHSIRLRILLEWTKQEWKIWQRMPALWLMADLRTRIRIRMEIRIRIKMVLTGSTDYILVSQPGVIISHYRFCWSYHNVMIYQTVGIYFSLKVVREHRIISI
jgi:hypothetical protein